MSEPANPGPPVTVAPRLHPAMPESLAGPWHRRLGSFSVLAVLSLTLPPLGGLLLLGAIHDVAPWLRSHGITGVVLYALGFTVLAGLALLPTYAQAVLAGWAFGWTIGWPAAVAGFAGAASLGYLIARRCAGDRMVRLLQEKPRWRAVHQALVGSGDWRALWIVTLVRLPPNSPFAAGNLVLASAGVRPLPFLLGTVLGMAPRTGLAVYLGSTLEGLDFNAPGQAWMAVAGIAVSILVVLILGALAQRALRQFTSTEAPPAAPMGGHGRNGRGSPENQDSKSGM